MELRGSRMRCVLAALGALTFAGCNFGGDVRQGTDGASAVIGPGGGMLALSGGAALEIPAGANSERNIAAPTPSGTEMSSAKTEVTTVP